MTGEEGGEGRGLQKVRCPYIRKASSGETVWASRREPAVYHGHPQTSWWALLAQEHPKASQSLRPLCLGSLHRKTRRSQRAWSWRAGALTVGHFPSVSLALWFHFCSKWFLREKKADGTNLVVADWPK